MMNAHARFCQAYEIEEVELLGRLYEIDELILFLPPQPTVEEKKILQALLGLQGETYGYMDWVKSNNTFELIMQWREQTENL
ncbi:hypothetical protein GXP67_17130 [Rhodocytophaga rosea]|uniref:Uncharacterized protein n=1 Tax=Rhodocytophaga rosea TaxID=2704465 RepID=A0A6C0GKS7_9BACT|nr:hypothetical protein [Rhodocytophaga rosea]QHT68240.1 hypothetical protein GXP67_17130 [Rhodocytophaga rosea]